MQSVRTPPEFASSTQQYESELVREALPKGTRIGGYQVIDVLGRGGFGIVYLALDSSLQRQVAIKEYMPSSIAMRCDDQQVWVRSGSDAPAYSAGMNEFLKEAKLLAQFDHSSLARVHSFWEENRTAYMAMPYYDGPTLAAKLRSLPHPPSEDWLRKLLVPLLDALETLHVAMCYHRDISPDNIILLANDRPVLLDFGVAQRAIGDKTLPLTELLNPAYAPIEQYSESAALPQGPWTDLYALAGVLHFAITGQAPARATVRAIADPQRPLSETLRTLQMQFPALRYSESFLNAIDRTLAVKPQDRPRNVPEFQMLLDRATPVQAPAANTYIRTPTYIPPRPDPHPWGDRPSDQRPADARPSQAAPTPTPTPTPTSTPAPQAPQPPQARQPEPPPAKAAPQAAPAAEAFHFGVGLDGRKDEPSHADSAHGFGETVKTSPSDDFFHSRMPEGGDDEPGFGARHSGDEWRVFEDRARRRPPRRNANVWLAAGLFAACIGAAGAWWWTQNTHSGLAYITMADIPESVRNAVPPLPDAVTSPPQATAPNNDPLITEPTAAGARPAEQAVPAPTRPPIEEPVTAPTNTAPAAPAAAPTPAPTPAPVPTPVVPQATGRTPTPAPAAPSPSTSGMGAATNPAPANPAPPVVEPNNPRAICGTRTNFALHFCMQTQCERPKFTMHAQCINFKRTGEVE